MKELDEKLLHNARIAKIRSFKNPAILMNADDLNDFKDYIKNEVLGIDKSGIVKYMGIPIQARDYIERGTVVVYDQLVITASPFLR